MTRRGERGSALMLMPAAILIVFVLGSIALDFSIIYLRQRQSLNLAADVANDAAVLGTDPDAFRRKGEVILDQDSLDAVADRYERQTTFADDVSIEVVVTDIDPPTVRVDVTVVYELVFIRVIPGADRRRTETYSATAVSVAG